MSHHHYDFFVIGAGSGGVRAARIAAGHGANVGIAEGQDLGGTCVNRGCVPKKILVYSAKMNRELHDAQAFGWHIHGDIEFHWKNLIHNKDREIKRLNQIYHDLLQNAGVTIHQGYARFTQENTVTVNNTIITADKFLITVGGMPHKPNIPGSEYMITSDEAFHLPSLPKNIVMIGGGYIAVEFAGIFHGMGSKVTLVNRGKTLLRPFDHYLQESLVAEMHEQGIQTYFHTTPEKLEKTIDSLTLTLNDGTVLSCDCVMAATGRVPNTKALHLQNAGIKTENNGKIKINRNNQTNIPHIYALGDIANDHNLTPVALKEGHALADRLFGHRPNHYIDYSNIPTAVFSQPPIGTVGMTEAQARQEHHNVEIYETSFRPMKNTISGRNEKSYMKLIVDKDSRIILGAHMLGDDAPEIIQAIGIVLKMKGTKEDFDQTIGIHPTAAEEFVTMRTVKS